MFSFLLFSYDFFGWLVVWENSKSNKNPNPPLTTWYLLKKGSRNPFAFPCCFMGDRVHTYVPNLISLTFLQSDMAFFQTSVLQLCEHFHII